MANGRKEVAAILKVLVSKHGATVRLTGSGHYRVTIPGKPAVTMSKTPNDYHALSNAKADVKKYLGVDL